MIGVNDMPASEKFYDVILGAIAISGGAMDDKRRCFWRSNTGVFGVTPPLDGKPVTGANGGTIGFLLDSLEQGDAWHVAGLANGGITLEDAPVSERARQCILRTSETRQVTKSAHCILPVRDSSGSRIVMLSRLCHLASHSDLA
jgi:catechol 2,3-dioxygenase-like lactoylglutathione lyase family enzyme